MKKMFFMDDGLLCGTPEALSWSMNLINKLEPRSGLFLKFSKMDAYAPSAQAADECRKLLPKEVKVHYDPEMNFTYLRTPIGSDEFVQKQLEIKLRTLQRDIQKSNRISPPSRVFYITTNLYFFMQS